MPQWFMTVSISLIPSLVVGICTAVISVRLALRRFYAERWWERKADAYSRIIEALYIALDYFDNMYDRELALRAISEERVAELQSHFEQAARELRKATRIGAYIISDDIAEALERLEKRQTPDLPEASWLEVVEAEYAAYKATLAEIKTLAKQDLRIR